MRKVLLVSGLGVSLGAALALLWMQKPSSAQTAGAELVIYTGENFTGQYYTVTSTLLDMPKGVDDGPEADRYGWNDSVKSLVVVRGTFRLCMHGRLNTKIDDTPVEELTVEAAKAKGSAGGWSCLVSANSQGPVQFASPINGVWGSDISSIALVSEENLPDWVDSPQQ
jgi:hypothetical protein